MDQYYRPLSADTAIIATNKYLSFQFQDFFELTKCGRTRGNHDYKLHVKKAIRNYYKYSTLYALLISGTSYPKDVVHASSIIYSETDLRCTCTQLNDCKEF